MNNDVYVGIVVSISEISGFPLIIYFQLHYKFVSMLVNVSYYHLYCLLNIICCKSVKLNTKTSSNFRLLGQNIYIKVVSKEEEFPTKLLKSTFVYFFPSAFVSFFVFNCALSSKQLS